MTIHRFKPMAALFVIAALAGTALGVSNSLADEPQREVSSPIEVAPTPDQVSVDQVECPKNPDGSDTGALKCFKIDVSDETQDAMDAGKAMPLSVHKAACEADDGASRAGLCPMIIQAGDES